MSPEERNAVNQAAFPKLKPVIDANYPLNQFVAIAGGEIVADDADFEQLQLKLAALGLDDHPMSVLVERAGDDTPDYLEIL